MKTLKRRVWEAAVELAIAAGKKTGRKQHVHHYSAGEGYWSWYDAELYRQRHPLPERKTAP